MAVFKQELNWSTYQDAQLSVLRSIESSLKGTLTNSKLISDNLTLLKTSIESTIRVNNSAAQSQEAVAAATSKAIKNTEVLTTNLDNTTKKVEKFGDTAERSERSLQAAGKVFDTVVESLYKIGKVADNWSAISNQFINISGHDGDTVREFRSEIVGVVRDLNDEIGKNFYNTQESYKQVVAISQGVTSNLGAIEEMAKPLLLTQETLDVNINGMAEMFNRFYTRYSFSSSHMEELVDEIRGNTTGNSADAEATREALVALERGYALRAGGDTELLSNAMEEISHMVAYTESLGIESGRYVEMMLKLYEGDFDSELSQILSRAGMTQLEANKLLDPAIEGGSERVWNALMQGETAIISQLVDELEATSYGKAIDDRGLSRESIDTYLGMKSPGAVAYDEWLRNYTPHNDAVDVVADKFITGTDRLENTMSEWSSWFADIQEKWGVGWTDAYNVLTTGVATLAGLKIIFGGSPEGLTRLLSSAATSLGSTITGVGTKVAPMLSSIGGALGVQGTGAVLAGGATVAAGIAGVLIAVKGIADTVKEIKAENKENIEGLVGVTKGLKDDKIAMMQEIISVDSNGNVIKSYSTELVSPDEYDPEKHLANLEKSYKKDLADHDLNDRLIGSHLLGKGDNWYDYIPVLGGVLQLGSDLAGIGQAKSEYTRTSKYLEFLNGLSSEEKLLASAYAGSGLMTNESQVEFLMSNWNKIKSLHSEGLAVELSKDGLKSPVNSKDLIGYSDGTNYISRDQLAILHEGEAVTPKRYNPAANMNELESLRERLSERELAREDESTQYLANAVETLTEIKEFLSYWRDDNIKRDMTNSSKSRFRANSNFVSNYLVAGR